MVNRMSIKENEYPYTLWVLDGDDKTWKMYKGMYQAKSAMGDDYDEILDKLNNQKYPGGEFTNNYIDWIVLPKGKKPNGKIKECTTESMKKSLNEAESYGWVVEDYQAQEAYEFACDYFGEDELNSQIVSCISNEELASCLAYIFRMNDFREWEESLENQDVDESIEHPNWMDDDVGFDIPWDENGFDIPKSAKDKSNKSAYWRDRRDRLNGESIKRNRNKINKEDLDYALAWNKSDEKIISKLNNLTNADTFWDDVRKLTKNIHSDRILRSWEVLSEKRYNELCGIEDVDESCSKSKKKSKKQ